MWIKPHLTHLFFFSHVKGGPLQKVGFDSDFKCWTMKWDDFILKLEDVNIVFFFLVKNVPLLEKVKLPADHLRNVEVEMHTKRRSHKCGIFHSHNKHSVWRGEVQERQNLFFLLISSGFNSSLAPISTIFVPLIFTFICLILSIRTFKTILHGQNSFKKDSVNWGKWGRGAYVVIMAIQLCNWSFQTVEATRWWQRGTLKVTDSWMEKQHGRRKTQIMLKCR